MTEPGFHHDGGGLYLQISKRYGTKSWVFRYRLGGKLRDMGLGSFSDFSLAQARERASEMRRLVADKIDPIDQKKERLQKLVLERKKAAVSFEKCAEDYHAREAGRWKNAKHADQWINTLRAHAFPVIGNRQVDSITKADVMSVLEPIWTEKPETASRVRQRIRAVLEWAAATELCPSYSPVMWSQIEVSLGTNRAKATRKHHAACPYQDVRAVLRALWDSDSGVIVKLAFEFTVLTAARSGEVRGAQWSEIKWEDRIWAIPGPRMKSGKEHRVPLSVRAIQILRDAESLCEGRDLIFCHPKTMKPYSDAVFTSLLHKGLGLPYTMHGFRSSFRDWGSEKTIHARELLEVSLAHLPGDSTELAYWRGDVLERRRTLMEEWAAYVGIPTQASVKGARRAKTAR
ncbi:MAG: integrase arm-type DNA-binding domain-containing protein [Rhizobacter sp.]|nr:integrase arm-type DNA-binding domain-containing protein [Rhizobacter sp.]